MFLLFDRIDESHDLYIPIKDASMTTVQHPIFAPDASPRKYPWIEDRPNLVHKEIFFGLISGVY